MSDDISLNYVWHYPLLFGLAHIFAWERVTGNAPSALLAFVVVSAVTIGVVSAASYWRIERPFLRYRRDH